MYKYRDVDGKEKFVYSWTLTGTDRTPNGKAPSACLRDMEKEIAKKLLLYDPKTPKDEITFSEFYEGFIASKDGTVRQSTIDSYNNIYDTHFEKAFGDMLISSITTDNVKALYLSMWRERGLKPSTCHNAHRLLHLVFETALYKGIIPTNPTNGVYREVFPRGAAKSSKKLALSQTQQDEFISYLYRHPEFEKYAALIIFLLGTGCRSGEAAGLTWDDCDFDRNEIHVRRTLVYCHTKYVPGEPRYYMNPPKTESGMRMIPMLPQVRHALLREKERQDREGRNIICFQGITGFVFSIKKTRPLISSTVDKKLLEIIEKYNLEAAAAAKAYNKTPVLLPKFSLHTLRHTFCSFLCENDVNIKTIQQVMGHSTIGVTMDIYTHISPEKAKDDFKKLGERIENRQIAPY